MPTDQWICEPDDDGLTLRSELFTVEISSLSKRPACFSFEPDCITSEFYADDNVSLELLTLNNKNVEIFGYYNNVFQFPEITITYKGMQTRKLTEHEKSELIKVLDAVKFDEKQLGF